MSESRAHVVRHGQSEWNFDHRIQGQSSAAGSLTARGRGEAAQAAAYLATVTTGVSRVLSSDIARAIASAEIIAGRLAVPIEIDPDFREINLGVFEGHRTSDPWPGGTVGAATAALWATPYERAPDGESVADLTDRVLRGLRRSIEDRADEEVVIVCHGGPMRALLGYAEYGAIVAGERRGVDNGAVEHFAVVTTTDSVRLSRIDRAQLG